MPRITSDVFSSRTIQSCLRCGLGILGIFGLSPAFGEESVVDPWRAPTTLQAKGLGEVAATHRVLRLDAEALLEGVRGAPSEPDGSDKSVSTDPSGEVGPIVVLPHPDGSELRFHVQRSSVLPESLAQRYPEINAYRGVGVDDPSLEARFELTPLGFYGMVLGDGETLFVNPLRESPDFQQAADDLYVAFAREDHLHSPSRSAFSCGLHDVLESKDFEQVPSTSVNGSSDPLLARLGEKRTSGSVLRTYRTAIATTGEYTRFHGGTVSAGLSAVTTAVNRLNAVLRRELSLRLTLVANNDALIFTDPQTDPYTNSDPIAMLSQNSATLNSVVGFLSFDLGHVLGTQGGGVARLGSACNNQFKARGMSGISMPVGDPFVVSYVAHEIGHQLGANHIFNGSTSACGGNRSPSSAYEPGSGSTIMSYAGICGGENLQQESDDYYNSHSFDEMVAFVHQGAGQCGNTVGGAGTPQVEAGRSYTVPRRTPFTLTGSGNARSYTWEQHDLGPPGPPNTDDGQRPLFRSYQPTVLPVRTFPRMDLALLGVERLGDALPTTGRALTFRLTGRNNQGGVAYDEVTLQVAGGSGPFRVLEPTAESLWTAGETVEVAWDVAGTDRAPVACDSVDILFSANGGQSFDTVLAQGVPNVGLQSVTAPDFIGTSSRVKVACSDNIFFALSTGGNFVVRGESDCTTDDTSFCLQNGRFKVSITWRDFADVQGQGRGVEGGSSADSGLFYFFAADNWEMLVKVIDGCAFNDHFWVFGAATTNVEYTLRVVDTQTGELYTFTNPLGQPSAAITDTEAFATCP